MREEPSLTATRSPHGLSSASRELELRPRFEQVRSLFDFDLGHDFRNASRRAGDCEAAKRTLGSRWGLFATDVCSLAYLPCLAQASALRRMARLHN
jgi:hypothetical protein